MHEVALATQLAAAVRRASGQRRVATVYITVGALRQVVPESLRQAWVFVTSHTSLSDAILDITWQDAVFECSLGHRYGLAEDLAVSCPVCGEYGKVIHGEEFQLIAVDLIQGT